MSREKVINAWRILVDKVLLRVAKGKKMFFKKCFPRLRREYRAGEMVQWLKALTAFPEDPGSFPRTAQWLTAVCGYSSRVSDTFFHPSRIPGVRNGARAGKAPIHIQNKHTLTKYSGTCLYPSYHPVETDAGRSVSLRPAQATASYRPLKATQWDNKLIN